MFSVLFLKSWFEIKLSKLNCTEHLWFSWYLICWCSDPWPLAAGTEASRVPLWLSTITLSFSESILGSSRGTWRATGRSRISPKTHGYKTQPETCTFTTNMWLLSLCDLTIMYLQVPSVNFWRSLARSCHENKVR